MNPSTSNPTISKSLTSSNPTSSTQKRTFTSSTSYRDQSSNQAANSSSPPPASSSSPLHHSSSSPPISPTFGYARTSSSNSSFADPLAANAKVFSSKSASFSRRDSRVGRAAITTVGSGIGRLESSDEDGMYLEPGSPSSGRGNRSLAGMGGTKSSNRGKKRSLPVSPQQSQTTNSLNRHFDNQRSSPGDDDDIFSSSRLMPPPSSTSISLDSHKSVLGGQEKWIAPSSSNQQDSVLAAGFYGSSDNTSASEDVNSSSDDAMDYGKPDKEGDVGPNNTSFPKNVNVGLGLGAAFEEKTEPQNPFAKAKSFQRWGSDPHSAFGALPSNSTSTTSSSGSSSNQNHHHPSQRRRLTGSSPEKLTRAKNPSRFGNVTAENVEMEIQQDTSEDSMVEDNDQHQQRLPSLIETQTAFWRNVVSDAVGIDVGISGNSSFKNSRSTLDASSKDLQFIHPCIADLKTYVQLAPPPPPDKIESSSTSSPRPNNHNNSKDNSTFEEDPHSVRNRQFAASLDRTRSSTFSRTTTPQNAQQALNGSPSLVNGNSNPSSPAGNGLNRSISNKAPLPSYEHLTLTLAQNQLSSLPSALFEVTKLTVLSLRNNKLRTLPPAISELRNLRELSIGANELSYLPSEILKLNNLTNFTYHPNPWMRAPPESQLSVRPLLGSTAWRLVASSNKRAFRTRQEDSNSTSIASNSSTLSASTPPHPVNTEASRQLMGPPALPLHIQASRARMLERTVSDAQVDDLLARGGGLGSIGTTMMTNGSSSLSPDPSPFPCEGRARYLSAVEIGLNPIPSLRELCIRSLLSPQPISINSPTINRSRNKILLDKYENGVLRKCKGLLYVETMRVLEVARRSSSGVWGSSSSSFGSSSIPNSRTFSRTVSGSSRTSRASKSNNNSKEKANWCSETRLTDHSNRSSDIDPDSMESDDADLSDLSAGDIGGKSNLAKIENTIAPIDVEASLDNGDDASKNPFFSRCPNPYHHFDPSSPSLNKSVHSLNQGEEENDWPIQQISEGFSSSTSSGPIFWEPVEVRYEWVSHIAGQKVASSKQLKTTFTGMEPQVEVEDSTLADQTNGTGVGNSSDVDRTITEENSESRKPKSNGPLVDGSGCLPIQWRGCSKGCLNFLDEVEE